MTLAGLRLRGVTSSAIITFVRGNGITRSDNSTIQLDKLEYHIREELIKTTPQTMVVLHPLKVVIININNKSIMDLDAKRWPDAQSDDSSSAYKRSNFQTKDSKDYYGLAPGKSILLRYTFPIKCAGFEYGDYNETVAEIHAEYDPSKKSKPKGVLHWVFQLSPGVNPMKVEVRLFEKLFYFETEAFICCSDDWSKPLIRGYDDVHVFTQLFAGNFRWLYTFTALPSP